MPPPLNTPLHVMSLYILASNAYCLSINEEARFSLQNTLYKI